MSAISVDILSWTNQDLRQSLLFNSNGVMYKFQTSTQPNGQSVTTLYKIVRAGKEDRVAKLEWAADGMLGRAVLGKSITPMSDLVRRDHGGGRVFTAPDGLHYRWIPSGNSPDILLQDTSANVVAFFRPTRPTRYQLGDVYGELHFVRGVGAGTIMHPPVMDTVIVSCMLYRFCQAFGC